MSEPKMGAFEVADSLESTRTDVVEARTPSAGARRRRSVQIQKSDGRTLNVARLRAAIGQLARAVEVLHSRGLLHLDIKPSNVLVGPAGRVVLLDFGLVRPTSSDMSGTRLSLGTPAYMAPEQAAGAQVGPAADWYAVGAVLYRALTGMLPFVGAAADVMIAKQLYAPVNPRVSSPQLPEDLCALAMDLLSLDPDERPTGPQVLARLGVDLADDGARESSSVFVGRDVEQQAMLDALDRARAGAKVVVTVAGAPSMGKSTLVRRALDTVPAKIWCMSGATFERESVPYVSFDRCIDELASHLTAIGTDEIGQDVLADLGMLSRLFPTLGSTLGALKKEPEHDVSRGRAAAALCRVLRWISDRQGVLPVIWIDNAQWSDRESALLMRAVLTSDEVERLLVVLSYRREEVLDGPLLAELHRLERTQLPVLWRQINVTPLTEDAALTLARALLPEDASPSLVESVVLEAAGNPLFVQALCREWRSGQVLEPDDTKISLHRLIARAVDRLSEPAREVLELLALAEHPMLVARLFAAARLPELDPVECLEELSAAGLVTKQHGATGLRVDLSHRRVRELVTNWIAIEDHRDKHRRLAEALSLDVTVDPERLAHHFSEGEQAHRAATFAVLAAGRAMDAFAFDIAAAMYERALGWLSDAAPSQRLPLTLALAHAHTRSGRLTRAALEYSRAADQLEGLDATVLRARAGELMWLSGNLEQGTEVLAPIAAAQGWPLEGGARNPAWRDETLLEAADALSQATSEAPHVDASARGRLQLLASLSEGASVMLPGTATGLMQQRLVDALAHGDHTAARRAWTWLWMASRMDKDSSARLEPSMSRAASVCAPPSDSCAALWAMAQAFRASIDGDLHVAAQAMNAAEQQLHRSRRPALLEPVLNHAFSLELAFRRGQLSHLLERAESLVQDTAGEGSLLLNALGEVFMAIFDLIANQPVHGRQRVRAVHDRLDPDRWTPLHYLSLRSMIWCDLFEGEISAAYWRLEGAWPQLRRSGLLAYAPWLAEASHLRSVLGLAASQTGITSRRRAVANARRALDAVAALDTGYCRGVGAVIEGMLAEDDPQAREAAWGRASTLFEADGHALLAYAYGGAKRENAAPLETLVGNREVRHPLELMRALTFDLRG